MSGVDFLDRNKLKTLIEICTQINSNYTDVDALMIYILESAMRLVECESSSLIIGTKNSDSLRFTVALGPKGPEVKNLPVEKKSIAGWVILNNQSIIVDDVTNDSRFSSKVQSKTGYVSRTMLALPMRVNNECIGVIELINKFDNRKFDDNDKMLLEMLSMLSGIAYTNAREYEISKNQISELQQNIASGKGYHTFIAQSNVMLDLVHMVDEAARTTSSVLITGESGVGKELFAEQLHKKSDRRDKPFIRVNCAALSPSLLESELFGSVKGAYTDATDKKGRFEEADGGTLFLDEIGELPLNLQSKLLRALQERTIEKVGSSKTINVDIRIIAATNKDLEKLVEEKLFRDDLYYRLNVVPIKVPPLRDRKNDIKPLADYFLQKSKGETKKNFQGFTQDALNVLYEYYWPGNIRELENAIERACVLGNPPYIQAPDLHIGPEKEYQSLNTSGEENMVLSETDDNTLKTALNNFKKDYVTKILKLTKWNQTRAAKVLDIQRTYLARLITEFGIRDKNK